MTSKPNSIPCQTDWMRGAVAISICRRRKQIPDFEVIDATETPYLNAEGSSTMEPADISAAMSEIFKQVFEFMQANAIAPAGPAISVYPGYDPKTMNFRAGFIIHRQDMWKASGPVAADLTPSGPALHFTHTGSYRTLRDDYGAMMQFAEDQSLMVGAPAWEIYINDPSQTPEAELLTECYAKLASAGLRLTGHRASSAGWSTRWCTGTPASDPDERSA
jgi:effector-binding domain-containing protein